MDFFFKNNRIKWQYNQFRGLNFTSVMDYNRLFLSRGSIINDENPWALGAGAHPKQFVAAILIYPTKL